MVKQSSLGQSGPSTCCPGYWVMGMEGYYGTPDSTESARVFLLALTAGMHIIDAADGYGKGRTAIPA